MFTNVELRKLPAGSLYSIVDILETNNDWKKVMALIPKNPLSEQFEAKYNNEHQRIIEESAKATGRRCAEILFEEWSTSGRVRPTLKTLKDIVTKAQIYRAADEISIMMSESLPIRPIDGPAATINTDVSLLLENERKQERLENMNVSKTDYFDKSANNKVTRKIGENHTFDQKNTISDLIKLNTIDLPILNGLQHIDQPISKETTAQLNSSNYLRPNIEINGQAFESNDIPKLSELLASEGNAPSDMQSSISSKSNDNEKSQYQNSDVYQTSLPNIGYSSIDTSNIDSTILKDTNLIHFKFNELASITNNFAKEVTKGPWGITGCIGSGGFGEVFVGSHHQHGLIAVKKSLIDFSMHRKPDIAIKAFNAEVRNLSQFRHKNIVPIIGFSYDGPALCVVVEYINGGSLLQIIAAKILNEKQRFEIMVGTADGLKYLHRSEDNETNSYRTESGSQSSKKNNFVHGDVKSANILLTKDFIPKLCDFGLAKQFDATCYETTSPMGTSAYMAPEGFSGTITQKIDIYSFGIVLLELLTGLRPIIEIGQEKINIKDHIEDLCENYNITPLLDPVVVEWKKAGEIYKLALKCLERQRKNRPNIEDLCQELYDMKQEF